MEDFLSLFKNKTVGYLVIAFVVFTGLVDLKMAHDPNARPDANTGEDGRKRDRQIEQLQHDVEILSADVMSWRKTCEDRYDAAAVVLGKHATTLEYHKELISECVNKTRRLQQY